MPDSAALIAFLLLVVSPALAFSLWVVAQAIKALRDATLAKYKLDSSERIEMARIQHGGGRPPLREWMVTGEPGIAGDEPAEPGEWVDQIQDAAEREISREVAGW